MKNNILLILISAFLSFSGTAARAQETPGAETPAADPVVAAKLEKVTPKQGVFSLGEVAELKTGDTLAFIGQEGADILVHEIWGNPKDPEQNCLGVITPKNFSPLDAGNWAVVVTYENEGHVSDEDAASINYTELLASIQESALEANPERVKAGYPSLNILGWAKPPQYDAQAKKLVWAKEIHFDSQSAEDPNTLNYDIRILGRSGILSLNVISDIKGLAAVDAAAPEILKAVEFKSGQRYADFNESTDKAATYGLAALVAGGAAAKAGLFKGLIAILLAGKKFIIIGLIALAAKGGAIWRWVRGKFFRTGDS